MKKLIITASLLMLTACISAGVKVEPSKLAQLEKGKTTYNEVVQKFGNPTQIINNDDGTKIGQYFYVSSQPRPESFIPYVGVFAGGADTENSTVTLNFNKRDILQSYSSSHGSVGAGTGFEANSQVRNNAQPSIMK